MPRLRVAARRAPARTRPRRAVRLRLPGPADLRREADRRPVGSRRRLHRPARLGRGLPPRRGLGRPRSDVGPVRRRGTHPARGDPAPQRRRPDHRRDRPVSRHPGLLQHRHTLPRGPARHAAVHPGTVGPRQRARRDGRRADEAQRRAPHHGRRTHLRVRRRPDRPRVDHRRRRPAQAPARLAARRTAQGRLRAAGPRPAQPGQVVSGRAVAALADRDRVAQGRRTRLARSVAARRPVADTGGGRRRDRDRDLRLRSRDTGRRARPETAVRLRRDPRTPGRAGDAGLRGPAGPDARTRGTAARRPGLRPHAARRPEAGPGGVRRRPRGPRGGRRGGAGTGVRLGGTPTETARPARRRGHRPVRLRAAAQPLRGRHRLAVRGVDAAPRPHRPDPRHLAGRSAPTPELVVVGSGADAVRGRSVGLLRRPCPPTRPRRSASR